MDTNSVNAFSDELKPAWKSGYHNGYHNVPHGEKIANALNKFPLLRAIYLLGYEAGKEDAANEGKWTDRGRWSDIDNE